MPEPYLLLGHNPIFFAPCTAMGKKDRSSGGKALSSTHQYRAWMLYNGAASEGSYTAIKNTMKKLGIGCAILGVLGLVALIIIVVAGGSYNRLVRLSQGVDKQWAQVRNVYQRRADLVPNLVATVSGAANFEKSTLTEITAARASVGQVKVDPNSAPAEPAKLAEFERAQSQLSSALSRLLVVVERHPELKANAN